MSAEIILTLLVINQKETYYKKRLYFRRRSDSEKQDIEKKYKIKKYFFADISK